MLFITNCIIFVFYKSKTINMKVSNKILKMLEDDSALRMNVALALGISEAGIKRNVERNSSNLTKIAAIRKIQEMTGLKENEILAQEKATV